MTTIGSLVGVSSDSWWIHMPSDRGAAAQHGDSGGPLAVFKLSERRWHQIGVMSAGILAPTQEVRDVYSPTFNNGDGNGDWIAKFIDDADEDQVTDSVDNCSPGNPTLTVCGRKAFRQGFEARYLNDPTLRAKIQTDSTAYGVNADTTAAP